MSLSANVNKMLFLHKNETVLFFMTCKDSVMKSNIFLKPLGKNISGKPCKSHLKYVS